MQLLVGLLHGNADACGERFGIFLIRDKVVIEYWAFEICPARLEFSVGDFTRECHELIPYLGFCEESLIWCFQ